MPPPPPPLSSPAIPSLCQKGVRKRLSRAFVADYVCNNTFAGADDVARPGEMAARLGVSAQALRNHGSRVNGSVHLETGELPPIRSTSEASVGAWTSRKMDRPRARSQNPSSTLAAAITGSGVDCARRRCGLPQRLIPSPPAHAVRTHKKGYRTSSPPTPPPPRDRKTILWTK